MRAGIVGPVWSLTQSGKFLSRPVFFCFFFLVMNKKMIVCTILRQVRCVHVHMYAHVYVRACAYMCPVACMLKQDYKYSYVFVWPMAPVRV